MSHGNGEYAVMTSKGDRLMIAEHWMKLIDLCEKLGHGEIERLRIQDGLPVLAEMVTQKIKLS